MRLARRISSTLPLSAVLSLTTREHGDHERVDIAVAGNPSANPRPAPPRRPACGVVQPRPSAPPNPVSAQSRAQRLWKGLAAWPTVERTTLVLGLVFAGVVLTPTLRSAEDGMRSREAADWANDKDFLEYCEQVRSQILHA